MKINFVYSVPKKYHKNLTDIRKALVRCRFDKEIGNFFPELKHFTFEVLHKKSLGNSARFHKNRIYFNFDNYWESGFRCLVHEAAHILLKAAGWEKTEGYKKIKSISEKKRENFVYKYDQSIAILIQAYFEDLLGLRQFSWDEWSEVFECMEVEDVGEHLFFLYKKYFIDDDKKSILNFIDTVNIPNE